MFEEVIRKLTNRELDSNKYDFGHVLVFGGAPGMVGAPLLCAKSALRIGAGLVTIASSPEVIDKLEKRVLEIMTLRISGTSDEIIKSLMKFIDERRVSVLVAGPGFDAEHIDALHELLENIVIPVVLDAGAITSFSGNLDKLKNVALRNKNVIITPHDGELKKLTGVEITKVTQQKQSQVVDIAKELGVILVSKGHETLVTDSLGNIYANQSGSPALATAGTGDVLAGIIAGLISQDNPPLLASQTGVYIHGVAGEIASEAKTQASVIASDVIECIPLAIKLLSAS